MFLDMGVGEVSKVGDWKTIDQRELKASGARKKRKRAEAVMGLGGGAIVGGYASNPAKASAEVKNIKTAVGNNVKMYRAGVQTKKQVAQEVGRIAQRNPRGAAAVGGAALVAGGAGAWGAARGTEAYHQHKINQRRRRNIHKAWSEEKLNRHKKGSATLQNVTSTLGLTSLGLMGASAVARRKPNLVRISPDKLVNASYKTGVVSGGLSGINGFNFAGVQRNEALRNESKRR